MLWVKRALKMNKKLNSKKSFISAIFYASR
jgi:hypothetical protein